MATQFDFNSYFQYSALQEKLPFQINFKEQVSSEVIESVGGFDFPILNDLVSRESWFYGVVEQLNQGKTKQASIQLRNLSSELAKVLELKDLSQAVDILWNGSDEYGTDARYLEFLEVNRDKIEDLLESMKLAMDVTTLNWLRVTFFILSRVTPDWSISKTAMLPNKKINDIIALITKEANGGIDPSETSNGESGLDSLVVEDEGK